MAVVSDDSGARRPGALRWAAWIVFVQAVALLLGALGYGAWVLVTRPQSLGMALTAAVMVLVFGVVLLACGRGLLGGVRASVSPILLIELIMLPIGWSMSQAHQWAICAALVVPSLVVIGLLFSPDGRAVVKGDHD